MDTDCKEPCSDAARQCSGMYADFVWSGQERWRSLQPVSSYVQRPDSEELAEACWLASLGCAMSTKVERHGTSYRYKMGCRCGECRSAASFSRNAARTRRRAEARAANTNSSTFTFEFSCPNCGQECQHINSSQPRPDLNQRSTALVKCTKAGCRKEWLLILVAQPAHQD